MSTNKKRSSKNTTKKRKEECMEKKCSDKTFEKKHKELQKIFEDSLKRNEKKLKDKNTTEEERKEATELIKNAKKNIVMMNTKSMKNKNIRSMRAMCKINNCSQVP